MHRTRSAAAAVVALLALAAVAAPGGAATAGRGAAGAPGTAGRGTQPAGTAGEYVVAFHGDTATATAAVATAGGRVVDVIDELDLALVATDNAAFAAEVTGSGPVTGVVRNHSVGTERPDMPHRWVEERPTPAERAAARRGGGGRPGGGPRGPEPLSDRQWDMAMIGATPGGAHRHATGRGVRVGIIDTGIDASHPDLAPRVDVRASRNFTTDIPAVDGPCEVESCVDPATVDDNGHGTHVAGIVAAARNRLGISGVAPDATLVNVRAGQDYGYFFVWETVKALVYAGAIRLDVVNMSFYVDPWLYNCDSRDDYVSGEVTDAELAEQAQIRRMVSRALDFAHRRGVTLVAAAGNEFTDLGAPTRFDASSPDYPEGAARPRTVTNDCLDMPTEGPHTISVSSVGPSETKSDFSNYGLPEVEVAAPGGWFRDYVGTPRFQTPGNLVLSSYPLDVAIAEGLADENGQPTDDFSAVSCDAAGRCGFYTYLQGTSMAAPHVSGVAALVIEAHGRGDVRRGHSLAPDTVRRILRETARDHACPPGGVEDYTDEGRPPEWNATCTGTTDLNGFYGEGIVDAVAAVR